MAGNAGDDWIEAGDNGKGDQWIYGDNFADDDGEGRGYGDYDGELDYLTDKGDDVIYGGESI